MAINLDNMTNRGSSSASPPDSTTRHQKKKRDRKLGLLAAMPKLNRRRFYLALKVMLLFVVFGLYFVLLLRESMSAFSAGGRGKGSGKVEQVGGGGFLAN